MKVWIEVSNDLQWKKKAMNILGLNAPASTRYENMMKRIGKDDVILHYITTQLAKEQSHKSAIVGISLAKSKMEKMNNRYKINLKDTLTLPVSIKFNDFSKISKASDKLKQLLHTNLQRYLGEIELSDLSKILKLKKNNYLFLEKTIYASFMQ